MNFKRNKIKRKISTSFRILSVNVFHKKTTQVKLLWQTKQIFPLYLKRKIKIEFENLHVFSYAFNGIIYHMIRQCQIYSYNKSTGTNNTHILPLFKCWIYYEYIFFAYVMVFSYDMEKVQSI